MRQHLTPALFVLSALVLAGCGASALAGEVSGSYTNAYDGYTIDVPVGWRVEPASAPGATASIYSYLDTAPIGRGEKVTKIEIYVDSLPWSMSLMEALDRYALEPSVRRTPKGLMEIGGHPALLHDLQAASGPIRMVSLVHESRLFTILVYGDPELASAVVRSLLLH